MSTEKHHPSFVRLVQATGERDRLALADMLGQTKEVINNWATRPTGVSKEGALVVEAKTGLSPSWLLTGVMPPPSDYLATKRPTTLIDKAQSATETITSSAEAVMLGSMLDTVKDPMRRLEVMSACVNVIVLAAPQPAPKSEQDPPGVAKRSAAKSHT
jgi:hypothetical protein